MDLMLFLLSGIKVQIKFCHLVILTTNKDTFFQNIIILLLTTDKDTFFLNIIILLLSFSRLNLSPEFNRRS